jgi:hypothetical protein
MRRRYLAILLVVVTTASCRDVVRPRAFDRSSLAIAPTTTEWKPGSVWEFSTIPKRGKTETFRFRVTDQATRPCAEGAWKRLEPIAGPINASHNPAYLVQGNWLTIRLTGTFCHVGMFEGELVGDAFRGNRDSTGPGDGFEGVVNGKRVE